MDPSYDQKPNGGDLTSIKSNAVCSKNMKQENVMSPQIMSRMALNCNKAGMEGLDKERINQIIYEASKGSKFYENEKKKEETLNMKIQDQQEMLNKLSAGRLQEGLKEADQLLASLRSSDDLSRSIVHVDMDAFYAAVEMRDDPRLRNRPMAVGGMGMLSTSNYIARRFGVRAAMPGFIGLKLCPDLVLVEPNYTQYTAVSQHVRNIFSAYDPNFCPMSLDEAYLDFTDHLHWRATSSAIERTFLLRNDTYVEKPLKNKSAPNVASKSDPVEKVTSAVEQVAAKSHPDCSCDLNSVLRPILFNSPTFQHVSDDDSVNLKIEELHTQKSDMPDQCPECHKQLPQFIAKTYGVGIEEAVLEMRNKIEQRTELTASAGIAPNTMLAKVCSDKNKPNGQFRIHPTKEEVAKFIESLPIRKISGIGKVTERLLGALGVSVCSDLVTQRGVLFHLFSPSSFHHFMTIALGQGSIVVARDGERKSMSTERTFSEINQPDELNDKCRELSDALALDMQEEGLMGKTVTLKIKTVNFAMKTRSHTLQYDTNNSGKIFQAAKQLLKTEIESEAPNLLRLRLMGVRMSKLSPVGSTQTLASMFEKQQKQSPTPGSSNVNHIDNQLQPDNLSVAGTSNHSFQPTSDFQEISSVDCEEEEDFSAPYDNFSETKRGLIKNDIANHNKFKIDIDKNIQNKPEIKGALLRFLSKEKYANASYQCKQSNKKVLQHSTMPTVSLKKEADVVEKNIGVPIANSDQTESTVSQISSNDVLTCPICGLRKTKWSLDLLNSHIDECLMRQQNSSDIQESIVKTSVDMTLTTKTRDKVKLQKNEEKDTHSQNLDFHKNKQVEHHTPLELDSTSQYAPSTSQDMTSTPKTCAKTSDLICCPICGQQKRNWDLDLFNSHVDTCLSRGTIKDILHSQGGASTAIISPPSASRKRQSTQAPSSHPNKRAKDQASLRAFFR